MRRPILTALATTAAGLALATAPAAAAPRIECVPNGPVYAAQISGHTLYIGGSFTRLTPAAAGQCGGGRDASGLAAFDLDSGRMTSWLPRGLSGTVRALAVTDAGIWVGGDFAAKGGPNEFASDLALYDHAYGELLTANRFSFPAGARVNALNSDGRYVYVGGDFAAINAGGRRRTGENLARLGVGRTVYDTGSGRTVWVGDIDGGWQPSTNGAVLAVAAADNAVYVGGTFDRVQGDVASHVEALAPEGGALLDWDPQPNGIVRAIRVAGDGTVYVGGDFTTISAHPHSRVAAFTESREVQPWHPDAVDGAVQALATSGSMVFGGGTFSATRFGDAAGVFAVTQLDRHVPLSVRPAGPVTAVAAGGTRGVVAVASGAADGAPVLLIDDPGVPTATRLPAVSGVPVVGATVRAVSGVWDAFPLPTVTRSWMACVAAIERPDSTEGCRRVGEGDTLTITPDLVGMRVSVREQATSAGATRAAFSALSSPVTERPRSLSPVTITGTARMGQTLTAVPGRWAGSPPPALSYQWMRCDDGGASCTAVPGAVGRAYTLDRGDAGARMTVTETATNDATPGGDAVAVSAPATAAVTQPATNLTAPRVTGTAKPGLELVAHPGTWEGFPKVEPTVQWQRCTTAGACRAIPGARRTTYQVDAADLGGTLRIAVTGDNGVGNATVVVSSEVSTSADAPRNVKLPAVTGNAEVGETLTAAVGTWSGRPAPSTTIAWQRCSPTGAACTTIAGATEDTYVPVPADEGRRIRLMVTARNAADTVAAWSSLTAPVVSEPRLLSAPVVSGTPEIGNTLTGTPGEWAGHPAPDLQLRWQSCASDMSSCADIPGATSGRYTVTAADAKRGLRVVVVASNTAGKQRGVSANVVVDPNAPRNVTVPAITGQARVGRVITASMGQWTGAPTPSLTIRWERCDTDGEPCAAIAGAGDAAYGVVDADAGRVLRARVEATNVSGTVYAYSVYTRVVVDPTPGVPGPFPPATPATPAATPATPGTPAGAPAPTASGWRVRVTGPVRVGRTVTATLTGAPLRGTRFVWQRCATATGPCRPIRGATAARYRLVAADRRARLRVEARRATVVVTSPRTAAVR